MNEHIISLVSNDLAFFCVTLILITCRQFIKAIYDIRTNDSEIEHLTGISILSIIIGILSVILFILLTTKVGVAIYKVV